ncbi:uncharacterized protein MYCFIDRAFT_212131 [Pseudocercospora fijiensis CIRAD86]|uniref:Uncharacterized protein n=1 Tax=Pseudocercospora fijiensis (strain CIRAD86) TaxID=383855 RepID=M3ANR0_PSEFD|nr:uncharacterized protein MYCFIDRAFT_212131 [Pseudocercospora fijiensis CIRAD86]EME79102.1 hypothetical protein MYCFIDRAFT_212131 [Pseudocercospora fijiensis CIRAD86]
MSLARAFTIRLRDDPRPNIHIGRAASQRAGRPVRLAQISSPVALVSSSNALSFDAPDIVGTKRIQYRETSASSTSNNGDDTGTNHLTCFFKPAVDTKTSIHTPSSSVHSSFDAPRIPQRVPSHSKKAHEFVHRKRSVQRLISPPTSMVRDSTDMFAGYIPPVEAPKESPFGNELAQLDEVVEELSLAVRDAEAEEDLAYMKANGLAAFSAEDYLSEIHSAICECFRAEETVWI